jgi:hypothetical protein
MQGWKRKRENIDRMSSNIEKGFLLKGSLFFAKMLKSMGFHGMEILEGHLLD